MGISHPFPAQVCAAGRVSRALAAFAAGGSYSAAHIRRGELQYVSVRISADEWNATLSEWVAPREVLFVLTDEADRAWFAPIERRFRVFYLADFEHLLADLDDPNARGMVEQLVASAPDCRTFTGIRVPRRPRRLRGRQRHRVVVLREAVRRRALRRVPRRLLPDVDRRGPLRVRVLRGHQGLDRRRLRGARLLRLRRHPCLLYTSPSPRDLSTSRMPSSA